MNNITTTKSNIEIGKWQVIRPPFQSNARIEVGVVEVHPAIHNRIVYATRSRSEPNHDLGEELIVIQDFDESRQSSNPIENPDDGHIIACFSLEELVTCLNDFQQTHSHAKEELSALSIDAISSRIGSITVQTLGAVQHISFLDRESIRTTVAYGYVKDRPPTDGIYKLMIGFRRCIVTVTLFKTKNQKESYARGLSIQAYIGPNDFDEDKGVSKSNCKLPSSYAISISEHIIAFGCYDGGLRFYDLLQRKYLRSALGPNGRSNPIVRIMNANPIIESGDMTCQTSIPRIICASASAVAYLWELDLSVDVMNGDILYFNIPPPIALFDGIIAAISGKGLPLVNHPSLSPTSIASLSPSSSWEHTDTVNAQFEIDYDPYRDIMFWSFSPDCIGTSLQRHATKEERLNSSGSLVAWNLSKLPKAEWPPPIVTPCLVIPMLRTEKGRVLPSMVIPRIMQGVTSKSIVSMVYITSCGEIVTTATDMAIQHASVHRDVYPIILSDLSKMSFGDVYSVTASRTQPSLIVMGTQYGVLLAKIYESDRSRSSKLTTQLFNEESSLLVSVADQTAREEIQSLGDDSVTNSSSFETDYCRTNPVQMDCQTVPRIGQVCNLNELKKRLCELGNSGCEEEHDLEESFNKSEASTQFSEQREIELRTQMTSILQEQQQFCDSTKQELQSALKSIEYLQSALEAKEQSCAETTSALDALRAEVKSIELKFREDQNSIQSIPPKLADASKIVEILEMRLSSKNRYCAILQEEINSLKLASKRERKYDDQRVVEIVTDMISDDRTTVNSEDISVLEKDLSDLREKEESLRNYVDLLEEDKAHIDKELDEHKNKVVWHENENKKLLNTISEQKETIISLVDLLDLRERDHEEKVAGHIEQVSILESKYKELETRLSAEAQIAVQAEQKMISTQSANIHLKQENIRLENEAMQKQALYNAMKYELQNALNELAVYDRSNK